MVLWLALVAGLVSCVPPLVALARGVTRVRSDLSGPQTPVLGAGGAPPVLAKHFQPAVVEPAGETWIRCALLSVGGSAALGAVMGGPPGAVLCAVACGVSAAVIGLPVLFAGVVVARGAAQGARLIDERRVTRSHLRDPGAGHVALLSEGPEAAGALATVEAAQNEL